MKVIRNSTEIQKICRALCCDRKSIGFVPTMGFLHDGHLSLITKAQHENEIVVVSIFVNPLQFAPHEDLDRYPKDLENDIKKLTSSGVALLFAPSPSEMYSETHSTTITTGAIENRLCGQSRPHHFRGVLTVVAKLFHLVNPARAYFGQKDFQQVLIIKKMAEELNFYTDIVICPTVRETDGLALSSRNKYLNDEERKSATALYRALKMGENLIMQGIEDSVYIKEKMTELINSEQNVQIDYLELVNPQNLEDLKSIKRPVILAIAAYIGTTRLIDNLLIKDTP